MASIDHFSRASLPSYFLPSNYSNVNSSSNSFNTNSYVNGQAFSTTSYNSKSALPRNQTTNFSTGLRFGVVFRSTHNSRTKGPINLSLLPSHYEHSPPPHNTGSAVQSSQNLHARSQSRLMQCFNLTILHFPIRFAKTMPTQQF